MAVPERKKKPETADAHDINGLLDWYRRVRRDMPWRRTDDPYLIWLSEVMLQQTRVDQARPYFERFVARFPDIASLAAAKTDDILRLWEGLGYYSRARNMHKAANQIAENHGGMFPDTYEDVIALRGVGPYTAAAVMSIAYNRPYAVVDGNVMRVISRLFAIGDDIRKSGVQKRIAHLADEMLDRERPAMFNQAMMELGATVCTPTSPKCAECPLQTGCLAWQNDDLVRYPYKSPAKKRPHYHIAVGVLRDDAGRLLIARRPENAMLGGLWEFPGGKQEPGEELTHTVRRELREELGVDVRVDAEPFEIVRHAYSHFTITLHAFFASIQNGTPAAQNGEPLRWVAAEELTEYAFPKANRNITVSLVKNHTK